MHFAVDPQAYYMGKLIGVKGQVMDLSGVPTIQVERESDISLVEVE